MYSSIAKKHLREGMEPESSKRGGSPRIRPYESIIIPFITMCYEISSLRVIHKTGFLQSHLSFSYPKIQCL